MYAPPSLSLCLFKPPFPQSKERHVSRYGDNYFYYLVLISPLYGIVIISCIYRNIPPSPSTYKDDDIHLFVVAICCVLYFTGKGFAKRQPLGQYKYIYILKQNLKTGYNNYMPCSDLVMTRLDSKKKKNPPVAKANAHAVLAY
ncbi:hypothetical protein F4809DRAFT_272482 [Biscogniauxia mediterranea]|nr:hypothetical protein F4809DRAFT_272482 [Biscogniauxia mediterranea]